MNDNTINLYKPQSPKVSTRQEIDNPLLPTKGVPVDDDNFIDSTTKMYEGKVSDYDNNEKNVWNTDPGLFYDESGLSGIDVTPNSNKPFDLNKFNIIFDRNKEIQKENQRIKDLNKLNALSQETNKVSLYNLSMYDIIVNAKNAWFGLLDDLLNRSFNMQTLTKDNRLFYLGLTIVIFCVILYIFVLMMNEGKQEEHDDRNIVYHIHQYQNTNPNPNK
jgi:hypothetical protein